MQVLLTKRALKEPKKIAVVNFKKKILSSTLGTLATNAVDQTSRTFCQQAVFASDRSIAARGRYNDPVKGRTTESALVETCQRGSPLLFDARSAEHVHAGAELTAMFTRILLKANGAVDSSFLQGQARFYGEWSTQQWHYVVHAAVDRDQVVHARAMLFKGRAVIDKELDPRVQNRRVKGAKHVEAVQD